MRKYLQTLVLLVLFLCTLPAMADVVFHNGDITNIRIIHWAENRACVNLDNNKWFKLDLNTEKGKATYAMALAAFTAGRKVRAAWLSDSPLE